MFHLIYGECESTFSDLAYTKAVFVEMMVIACSRTIHTTSFANTVGRKCYRISMLPGVETVSLGVNYRRMYLECPLASPKWRRLGVHKHFDIFYCDQYTQLSIQY